MSQTLLEITQDILSVMDGDEVNSINDTEESLQVAKTIVRTYNAIVSNSKWAHTRTGLTLVPHSDSSKPTHISVDDNVKELLFINYDKRKNGVVRSDYQKLTWKEPDDFLRLLNLRDESLSTVQTVIDDSGITLYIQNDKAPEYYTSFDDSNIIFDSFDSSVDSTIQESKIQAMGWIVPSLNLSDSAVPNLPPDAWAGFIEEATKKAQWWVRQMEDPVAEQESKRQRRWLSRKQWVVNGGIKYPDYGRKR